MILRNHRWLSRITGDFIKYPHISQNHLLKPENHRWFLLHHRWFCWKRQKSPVILLKLIKITSDFVEINKNHRWFFKKIFYHKRFFKIVSYPKVICDFVFACRKLWFFGVKQFWKITCNFFEEKIWNHWWFSIFDEKNHLLFSKITDDKSFITSDFLK